MDPENDRIMKFVCLYGLVCTQSKCYYERANRVTLTQFWKQGSPFFCKNDGEQFGNCGGKDAHSLIRSLINLIRAVMTMCVCVFKKE